MVLYRGLFAAGLFFLGLCVLAWGAESLTAQEVASGGAASGAEPDLEPATADHGGPAFFGHAPGRRRVIPGLFVMHPYDAQFPELEWTRGAGLQVSTWFAAGFMNSYDRFSLIAGVERNWFEVRRAGGAFGVGYRAGILTGYDERLMKLAGQLPALPFGGLLVWLQLGRVALDSFYVYKALTVEASFGF